MNNILLIEDDESLAEVITEGLSNIAQTCHASDRVEAFNFLRARTFDLILCDKDLGFDNGFDIIRQVKEHEEHQDTPVIFITGDEDIESKVEGFAFGAVDYLTKPFDLRELRLRVRCHLKVDTKLPRLNIYI